MTTKLKSDSAADICEVVFAGMSKNEIEIAAANLLNHALTHPWADDELRLSIVENICHEYDIDCSEICE